MRGCAQRQISRPVAASRAYTWLTAVTYIIPAMTTGVPSIIGMSGMGKNHCMASRATLSRSTWSRGEWRFPV